jgi:pimeloyl-ACP methyl ester carboxylesterase
VALLFADHAPGRVDGLVLVAATLPGPLTARQAFGRQTLGRLALFVLPPTVRGVLRLSGRRLLELKRSGSTGATGRHRWPDLRGGDPSRLLPEITEL